MTIGILGGGLTGLALAHFMDAGGQEAQIARGAERAGEG